MPLKAIRGFRTSQLPEDVPLTSLLDLGSGGDDVCPKLRLKGRRGRVIATSKLPVTREIWWLFFNNKGSHDMWWYILTFYAGVFFGIFILALCKSAGDYDRSLEDFDPNNQ